MPERMLAGCSYGSDCPRIVVLADGRVAVTGVLPDGREGTVVVSRGQFDTAARTWVAAAAAPSAAGGGAVSDG